MCLETHITGPVHHGFKTSISRLAHPKFCSVFPGSKYTGNQSNHTWCISVKEEKPEGLLNFVRVTWAHYQNCADPPGWQPSLLLCQFHCSALCHLQTFWGGIWPHCLSLVKMLKSTSSNKNLWVTPLLTGLPLDRPPWTKTPHVPPVNSLSTTSVSTL